MTESILLTTDLVCGYHIAQPLTVPLNIDIARNDIVAILGINGRGKSTLLHTLLGIQKPLSGKILTTSSLSFVPQSFNATFDYSVLEMVLMGRAKQLSLFAQPTQDDHQRALKNLQRLGLQEHINTAFNQLSGGQKQLVLIARALTAECQILVLDEPTSALDLYNQKRVLHILSSLVKERDLTIIFSTHDPSHAMTIANKVILLEQQCYSFGAVQTLLTEENLSRLYGITMKMLTVGQAPTIVPIYFDNQE